MEIFTLHRGLLDPKLELYLSLCIPFWNCPLKLFAGVVSEMSFRAVSPSCCLRDPLIKCPTDSPETQKCPPRIAKETLNRSAILSAKASLRGRKYNATITLILTPETNVKLLNISWKVRDYN